MRAVSLPLILRDGTSLPLARANTRRLHDLVEAIRLVIHDHIRDERFLIVAGKVEVEGALLHDRSAIYSAALLIGPRGLPASPVALLPGLAALLARN